jgi:hypothetical protein
VIEMGKATGIRKDVMLVTRVTQRISENVKLLAYQEGLNVSEWMRNLIISELKRTNSTPRRLYEPSNLRKRGS